MIIDRKKDAAALQVAVRPARACIAGRRRARGARRGGCRSRAARAEALGALGRPAARGERVLP